MTSPDPRPLDPMPSTHALRAWWSALHQGHLDQVQHRLAAHPGWAHVLNARGWSGLHEVLATPDYGSLDHRLAMIDALLPHSNVRWADEHPGGMTPLIIAAQSCQVEVIRRLLPLSNPRAATADGTTALIMAASCGHEEVVAELLPVSDPHATDEDGMTAAMAAARNDRRAALDELWPTADRIARNRHGDTVVLLVARHGITPLLERWLDNPTSDLSVRNQDGQGVVEAWQEWLKRMTRNGSIDLEHGQGMLERLIERRTAQEWSLLLDGLAAHGGSEPGVPARSRRPRI